MRRRATPPSTEVTEHRKHTLWSHREVMKHEEFIERLMLLAVSDRRIEQLAHQELGISMPRARTLRWRILERWKVAGQQEAESNRIAAIRRLKKNVADVHTEYSAKSLTSSAKHSALARYESLLIPLEGTSQPIKIEHDLTVSVNLVGVIANLTPEQAKKYIDRRKALELAAGEYQRLHPGSDQAAE